MRHVHRNQFDSREPVRSIYEGGLREVFAACHAPLPPKMEQLLQRLEVAESQQHAANERRV